MSQDGAITQFDRVSGAGAFNVRSNQMEKLSLQSFAGNDTLTTNAGVPLGMSIDAGPGDDVITTGGRCPTASSATAATTRSTAPAATTRSSGPTATATTS